MSTELMTAENFTGTVSMTGYHRDNKRRFQLTVFGKGLYGGPMGDAHETKRVAYVEVDAETIANMQRCVDEYRELYPDSED